MVKLSFTVTIDKDFETVWEYYSDFTKIVEWDPNTVKCSIIKKEDKNVGSIYNLTSSFNGNQSEIMYTLKAYQNSQRQGYIILTGQNDKITALDYIICRRLAKDKTEIEYRANIRLKGVGILFTPFILCPLSKLAQTTRVGCRDKARELWGNAQ